MAKKHKGPATHPLPTASRTLVNLERLAVPALFVLPLVFYGRFLTGSVMMFGTDFIGAGGYAARQFMAEYIRNHLTIAFWQPQILSGQPTVAAFFGDLFYPTLFLRLLLPVHTVWAWTFFLHTFLAGLGTYLFLKEMKLDTIPAFLAGVAYMFAGSLLTLAYAGHDGRLIGSALMPLALFFLLRGMNRRQLIWFVLSGVVLALQLLSGHIQKVYYTGLILVAFFVFLLVRFWRAERKPAPAIRLIGYFVIGMLFTGALAAIQYLPIYGNLPYGVRGAERGYEFAASWSMPIAEILDLLTPRFSGGLWNYWGKNPFKLHSEYLGILPLLFALIGIFRAWQKPAVRFFFFSFIVTVLMAWGGNTPFYRLPYHLLPGLSKFRGPAMIFFLAAFAIAVLTGYGIQSLFGEKRTGGKRSGLSAGRITLYAGAAILLFFLIAIAARDMLAGILNPGARLAQFETNYPAFTTGLLFAVILWATGYLLVALRDRQRLPAPAFALITALIMTADIGINLKLWDNNQGYIRAMPVPDRYFAPDEVVRFLRQDTTIYRVLPLNYQRSDEGELWLHNIHSTGGQMPNPLQTYQEFIGAEKTVMFQANNLLNPNFMNLLNIKYVITLNLPEDASRFDPQSQMVINQLKQFFSQPQFQRVFSGVNYSIYENAGFLPRCFVTGNYEVVANRDELFARLMRPDFNPLTTALIYQEPGFSPHTAPAVGTAEITHYDANRIKIHARLTGPGLLVLSENYHPDWRVTVNGKPAPLLQAFHTLRAVALPAGEHQVEFFYRSRYFQLGTALTIIATICVLLLGMVNLFRSAKWRHRQK